MGRYVDKKQAIDSRYGIEMRYKQCVDSDGNAPECRLKLNRTDHETMGQAIQASSIE